MYKLHNYDSKVLMKFRFLASILFILFIDKALAQDIVLDGALSPDEWSEAIEFDLEYEVMPSRNTPAQLKTTAYVKYDEKYLYVGVKAYGDPSKIRATLKNRDQTWNEDYVALMADPFVTIDTEF